MFTGSCDGRETALQFAPTQMKKENVAHDYEV